MPIELKSTAEGIRLPIHVSPGSRRAGISGVHDGRLKVAVIQVAEKGKANQEVIKLLASQFGLAKSQVSLVSGETSSRKVIMLSGVSISEVQGKLAEWTE